MAKAQQASGVSPGGEPDPVPPRGLTKAEKSEFQRVCGLRRQAGKPVSALETDVLVDYCQTRARLAVWQKKLRHGQSIAVDSFRDYPREERMLLSEQLALAATLDRTAAACRRLARDLGLVGG